MLVTLLPPNMRHTGPAHVTVGPSTPGRRSAVSGLFISTQTMINGIALCVAWLSPSVTTLLA